MLANGATLGYTTTMPSTGTPTYTNLPGLKEIPDMGIEPEKVENTCLTDTVKKYENGIGEPGDLTYKFKYDNTSANSPYRVLRDITPGTTVYFKETLADGTITEFAAQTSVKRTGGSVNGVIEFELALGLQSEFDYTDPT